MSEIYFHNNTRFKKRRTAKKHVLTIYFFMHLFHIYRRSSYGKIWNKTAKCSIQMDLRSVPQIPTLLMTTGIESGARHVRHVLREWSLHQHVVPHWFAQQLAIAYHARQVPTQRKPIAPRVKPALTVAQKRS